MKHEVYVNQIVKLGGVAEAKVAQLLEMPTTGLERQLRAHGAIDAFAVKLERKVGRKPEPEEVFAVLAEAIDDAFVPPTVGFERYHLECLLAPAAKEHIGLMLRCPPTDALHELFEPERIRACLRRHGVALLPPEADIETLLRHVDETSGDHELNGGFTANGWGKHIEVNGWLRPAAKARLVDYGRSHGRGRGSGRSAVPTATGLLAAAIGPGTPPVVLLDNGRSLGALALLYLQRRLALLVERLRVEAADQARQAVEAAPVSPEVRRLPGWILLYEQGAVRAGLIALAARPVPIRSLLPAPTVTPHGNGQPDPAGPLEVNDRPVELSLRQRLSSKAPTGRSFDVTCEVDDVATTILEVGELPQQAFATARRAIMGLRGRDLSPHGDTIGERLLNTEVELDVGLRSHLRRVVESHDDVIARSAILAGHTTPFRAPAAWATDLNDRLPDLGVRPGGLDARFPRTTRDLVDEWKEEMSAKGAAPTPVSLPRPDAGHEDEERDAEEDTRD